MSTSYCYAQTSLVGSTGAGCARNVLGLEPSPGHLSLLWLVAVFVSSSSSCSSPCRDGFRIPYASWAGREIVRQFIRFPGRRY